MSEGKVIKINKGTHKHRQIKCRVYIGCVFYAVSLSDKGLRIENTAGACQLESHIRADVIFIFVEIKGCKLFAFCNNYTVGYPLNIIKFTALKGDRISFIVNINS